MANIKWYPENDITIVADVKTLDVDGITPIPYNSGDGPAPTAFVAATGASNAAQVGALVFTVTFIAAGKWKLFIDRTVNTAAACASFTTVNTPWIILEVSGGSREAYQTDFADIRLMTALP